MIEQSDQARSTELNAKLLEKDEESKAIQSDKKLEEKDSDSKIDLLKKPPLWAYPLLLMTGASGAMDGPFSQLVTSHNAFVRMSWKFQGVFLLFLIYKLISFIFSIKSFREEISEFNKLERKSVIQLVFTAIGLLGMQSFLSWGATYTIMSHANLFSSLCAIMIVSYRLITFKRVTTIEIIGSLIALSGCALTTLDSEAEKVNQENNNIMLGNLLSFCSSIFATVYITVGQQVAKKIQTIHYFLILTFFVCLIFFTVFPIASRNSFTFDFDLQTGLFGWLTKENFLYCIIVLSFINGCGTLGLQYLVFTNFSPIIAGTMMLQEPFFSQFYGLALGLDQVPGVLTNVGGIIVIVGLFILVYYSPPEIEDKDQHQKIKDQPRLQ